VGVIGGEIIPQRIKLVSENALNIVNAKVDKGGYIVGHVSIVRGVSTPPLCQDKTFSCWR
jgi:hypothetical protein